jgi:hypothetical protein
MPERNGITPVLFRHFRFGELAALWKSLETGAHGLRGRVDAGRERSDPDGYVSTRASVPAANSFRPAVSAVIISPPGV